jgi:hypothetical protein
VGDVDVLAALCLNQVNTPSALTDLIGSPRLSVYVYSFETPISRYRFPMPLTRSPHWRLSRNGRMALTL